MILSVFGDDSADETRQRVFSVAAIIAPEEIWTPLETAWLDRTKGIPFHATDCEGGWGDYRNLSPEYRRDLYKDLTVMLANSGAYGFGATVDLAAHREFFVGVPEEMSYHFCFQQVVYFLTKWGADRGTNLIKFSFDNRIETNFNASYLYNGNLHDPDFRYRFIMADKVSFLCSKGNPRIQVSDLFARECMKHLDNMVGPKERPLRKSMEALVATNRFGSSVFTREYFEDKRRKFPILEKKVGFNETTLLEWLEKRGLIDNVSNRFRFMCAPEIQKLYNQEVNVNEFEKSDQMAGKVLKTPHKAIKAALGAENRAKKKPPKKRASGRASGGKD